MCFWKKYKIYLQIYLGILRKMAKKIVGKR